MMADGPEQREAHFQEQSERDFERIQADEDRADELRGDDPWMPTHASVQAQGDPGCKIEWDPKPPRGTTRDIYQHIRALSRAVLSLMSCEGLTPAEFASANEIWALTAMMEDARETRTNTNFQEHV